MKLLNSFVSTFAGRVRLAIYSADLPVEIAPSGQWLPNYEKSPEYLEINPIGKVPTLILDDGSALPESGVVVEYLADAFPHSGLRPTDPQAAAKNRLLAHLAEIYVQIPAFPLVPQIFAPVADEQTVRRCVAAMDQGLAFLDHFMGSVDYEPGPKLTIADCALAPTLFFFAERIVEALHATPIIDNHPNVSRYWKATRGAAPVAKVLSEMRSAIGKSPLKRLVEEI